MTPPVQRPDDLLPALLADDPARPRLTWYAASERIELSGRVLGTWVSKAANLLADDLDVGVGAAVALELPAHWRACYWALAAWTMGASVVVGGVAPAQVAIVVAAEAGAGSARPGPAADVVALTLPALARRSDVALPASALDEAAVLATYGDVVTPWERAAADDAALLAPGGRWTFGEVIPLSAIPGSRLLVVGGDDLAATLRTVAGAWAAGGSVVLLDGAWATEQDPEAIDRIRAQEAVTG